MKIVVVKKVRGGESETCTPHHSLARLLIYRIQMKILKGSLNTQICCPEAKDQTFKIIARESEFQCFFFLYLGSQFKILLCFWGGS